VPFAAYGEELRDHFEQLNRPMFVNDLATAWLPAIPELHDRLRADPPAWVADVGCGGGWLSIAIARAYPRVHVDGFDLDQPSIDAAQASAVELGLGERVRFEVRDAADLSLAGRYDLVVGFEMLHDLARPVDVLSAMRRMLAPGGTVVIMDEKVGESFEAPGDELERLYYGFSTLCCLPAGMAEEQSAMTGTVMRPSTLRRYAEQAGFSRVEVLPIEHDLFRFYRVFP
jgi:2-polyprenyl-3-methyl-5-hydroxy-6-metoxy-1,4-benzoquinol methylase